jgi:hypothetical protein
MGLLQIVHLETNDADAELVETAGDSLLPGRIAKGTAGFR